MPKTFFVTGTDTGVGKTVLTVLLVKFLRELGRNVAAFKPICSGGRDDARALQQAQGNDLTLDEINPWHFRAALAPALAAKREKKTVTLAAVRTHLRAAQKRCDVMIVEGAGGLLSPLGVNFDSRDLIVCLNATPVIVASNRLGVVNHLLLTLEALPKSLCARTKVVLMSPPKPDTATAANRELLAAFFPGEQIFTQPWLGANFAADLALRNPGVQRTLAALAGV